MRNYKVCTLVGMIGPLFLNHAQEEQYPWREEIDGKKAFAFFEKQNKAAATALSADKDNQYIHDTQV